jgi:hypothetical protein
VTQPPPSISGPAKICPDCQSLIPPPALACRICVERKARNAAVLGQAAYFPAMLDGRLELYIRRRFKGSPGGHIALFNFKHQAYCGEDLSHAFPRRESAPYTDDVLSTMCEKCVQTLRALIAAHQKRTQGSEG